MKCRCDNGFFALLSVVRRLKRMGLRFTVDCSHNQVIVLRPDGTDAFEIRTTPRGDYTFAAGPLVPRHQMLPALIEALRAAELLAE